MNHHLEFDSQRCRPTTPGALPPWPNKSLENYNILLASNSPRRRELLGLILPSFAIAPSRDVEEVYPAELPAADVPAFLSRLKASAYKEDLADRDLIVTADTVVIVDGEIMGKPKSHDDACAMLKRLSGRAHTVITGVTLTTAEKMHTFSEATDVHFAALSDDEISEYVERYKPFDKAGSYGIQEWIGAAAIRRIDGCFYNVMGLPLHALYEQLKSF